MINPSLKEELQEIVEHTNPDYPVGVYYVEPSKMYMNFVRWHWHDEIEINLVKEGSAMFHIGEDVECLFEGQAIFLNSNVMHSIESLSGEHCVILSLIFHPCFLFPGKSDSTTNGYMKPVLDDPDFRFCTFDKSDGFGRNVLSYINDIFSANLTKEFGYELVTKSCLCQLWLLFLKKVKIQLIPEKEKVRTLSFDEIRIKDAISYIEQHYSEAVTLEDISSSIHVSKSECCRCFRRAVDMTPFEYLMRYRILQAADYILRNEKDVTSISELAFSVGFNNTSYFNKLFREYFGCTPTQYRKQSKTEHRDKLSPFGLSLSHI